MADTTQIRKIGNSYGIILNRALLRLAAPPARGSAYSPLTRGAP